MMNVYVLYNKVIIVPHVGAAITNRSKKITNKGFYTLIG
jgi:hypothetical protein